MGFNIGSALLGGITGFLETGNPIGAAAMGIAGGLSGGGGATNAVGAGANMGMTALNAQNEGFQMMMYAEQLRHQEHMQMQSEAFDEIMDEKSETMREQNTLRDITMMQRKADNQITKKFIESITE